MDQWKRYALHQFTTSVAQQRIVDCDLIYRESVLDSILDAASPAEAVLALAKWRKRLNDTERTQGSYYDPPVLWTH